MATEKTLQDKEKEEELHRKNSSYHIFHQWWVIEKNLIPQLNSLKAKSKSQALTEIREKFNKIEELKKDKIFFEKYTSLLILECIFSPDLNSEITDEKDIKKACHTMLDECELFVSLIENNRFYFVGITDATVCETVVKSIFTQLEIIYFLFPRLRSNYAKELIEDVFLNSIFQFEFKTFLNFQKSMIDNFIFKYNGMDPYIGWWQKDQIECFKKLSLSIDHINSLFWKPLVHHEETNKIRFHAQNKKISMGFVKVIFFLSAGIGCLFFSFLSEENPYLLAGFLGFTSFSLFLVVMTYFAWNEREKEFNSIQVKMVEGIIYNNEIVVGLGHRALTQFFRKKQKDSSKIAKETILEKYPFFQEPPPPMGDSSSLTATSDVAKKRKSTYEEKSPIPVPLIKSEPSWFNGKLKFPHPCVREVEVDNGPIFYAFFLPELINQYEKELERVHFSGSRKTGIKKIEGPVPTGNITIEGEKKIISIPLDREYKINSSEEFRFLGGLMKNNLFGFFRIIKHLGKSSALPKQPVNISLSFK